MNTTNAKRTIGRCVSDSIGNKLMNIVHRGVSSTSITTLSTNSVFTQVALEVHGKINTQIKLAVNENINN